MCKSVFGIWVFSGGAFLQYDDYFTSLLLLGVGGELENIYRYFGDSFFWGGIGLRRGGKEKGERGNGVGKKSQYLPVDHCGGRRYFGGNGGQYDFVI